MPRHASRPALAIVRGTTSPAAPLLTAHDFLFEEADPPRGWRVLYAIDPVTRERIAEARCEAGDDVADLVDCLTRRVARRIGSARAPLTLA